MLEFVQELQYMNIVKFIYGKEGWTSENSFR